MMRAVIERLEDFLLDPGDDEDDPGEFVTSARQIPLREVVRHFWPDARPYRRWLVPLLVLVLLGSALDAALIWLYKVLVDDVLVPGDFGFFPYIAVAYLGLTVLNGLASFGDEVISDWVSERFLLGLRRRLFAHLQALPPGFFA